MMKKVELLTKTDFFEKWPCPKCWECLFSGEKKRLRHAPQTENSLWTYSGIFPAEFWCSNSIFYTKFDEIVLFSIEFPEKVKLKRDIEGPLGIHLNHGLSGICLAVHINIPDRQEHSWWCVHIYIACRPVPKHISIFEIPLTIDILITYKSDY